MQFVNIILAVVVVAAGSGLAAPLGYDFSNSQSEPRRLDDITVGPISNTYRVVFFLLLSATIFGLLK